MSECTSTVTAARLVRKNLWLSILFSFTIIVGSSQTLTTEFVDAGYSLLDAGSVPGVPANYGGLTIRPEEPNTLYIGGAANGAAGAMYSIELQREEETNRITGFIGTAEMVVETPNIDGGLMFAPNGTLLFTRFSQNELGQVLTNDSYTTTALGPFGISSSVGSLMLVPTGFSGAGNLIIASYNAAILYLVPYTISESGEYLLSEQTESVSVSSTASGPEGIAYIPQGSEGFPNPSMVVSSYGSGKVVVFDTDDVGLPITSTARDMITGLVGAEGALIDPVTGDFLFSTFGGGNRVIIMSGFENPNDCAGVPFGESILDDCGVCRLPDDPEFNSTCLDCAGVVNGTAFIDDCGDCVGGDTGEEACVFDCQDILANIGDPCDDGNEMTENDVIGSNCECAGELIPQENNAIACADGIDNDGDGLSDCEDPECQALSAGCSTCFNDGSSFADVVIDYLNTCPANVYTDPSEALGVPDFNVNGEANHATLGEGGHITLGFTDNTLVNSGNDDADLFVFEVGPLVEGSTIELRPLNAETENILIETGIMDTDEDGFYEFGAISGATAVVDIDAFFDDLPAGTLFFDAIKITDIPGNCSGISPGADIDGVCALSSVPCAIGATCDDGNDMTENDTIDEDCNCNGTLIATATLLELECGGDVIQITGALAIATGGGTATSETRTVYAFSPDGDGDSPSYGGGAWPYVMIEGSIQADASITAELSTNGDGMLLVNGHPAYQFIGNSGPNDANGVGGPWSYFLADGTPSQDACATEFDCPELAANIGDACDDGDNMTENDMVTDNCECVGTIVIDCPDLVANIGDACDDGDDSTENDVVTENCLCEGTSIYDCPELAANIGAPCDDGDNMTENDMVTDNCECVGTIVIDCPDLVANIGDACDDGDDSTENDVVTENCLCQGTSIYDCPELAANIGDACDDGDDMTENDMVTDNCECMGTLLVYDCPELMVNYGDPCDDNDELTINDVIGTDCLCSGIPVEPSDCEDWVMYLNNNAGGVSDIYSVDISGGDAELTYITTIDYQAHIAYNPDNNLIYVMHNGNGSYVTVNPHTVIPEVSAPVFLSQDIPSITTAAFAPNGKLLVGSMTEDIIYSINVADQMVSVFDAYSPINGGDIAFDDAGMLYLATRAGNGFYQAYPNDVLADQLLANIPSLVTGMALTESGQMIMSHKANSALQLRNLDGSDALTAYTLMLDGEAYAHDDGDMTSGCNTFQDNNEGDCDAFSTFYADLNRPGLSGSNIYGITFSGNNAVMSYLTHVNFDCHIAFNAEDNLLYLVNQNGNFIRAYNPSTDSFVGDLPIVGGLNNTVAVVYNPEDGLLYVGSNSGVIQSIDLGTGVASFFANAPVSGGDLAIQNGSLYLATRNNAKLHEIVGGIAVEVGSIPVLVNGMAAANNESSLIIANKDAEVFTEISILDAATINTYTPMLDGEAILLYDGDMASGCADASDEEEENPEVGESSLIDYGGESSISSYPNPTNGPSQVVFVAAETGRTVLEVYDMNGRNVSTLWNQESQAGKSYRVDFNGSNLPNGVYIYKMTTNKETIIEKFMIAR